MAFRGETLQQRGRVATIKKLNLSKKRGGGLRAFQVGKWPHVSLVLDLRGCEVYTVPLLPSDV